MNLLPLKFPDHHEEARKRAEEFRRLSSDERWRAILDTIETGMILIRSSPNRPAMERVAADREREWKDIQRELFRHHGQ